MTNSTAGPFKTVVASMSLHGSVFWQQVFALTVANLKTRYRNTVAGFIWVVMNPLIMYGAQSYAFRHVLKLQVANYSLFLLSALLPWIFLTQSLEMCTSLLLTSGKLLKSFPLNPLALLLAQLVDNTINFLAAFTLLLVPVWLGHPANPQGLAALPFAIVVLLAGTLGLSWLLTMLQVFFRDTRFLVSFGISVAFFVTPVFYPAEFVPERYRLLVTLNPLYRLIEPFRIALYAFDVRAFATAVAIGGGVAAALLLAAIAFWRGKRNAIYLNI